jgi:mono/diheme cytochrome c family protein
MTPSLLARCTSTGPRGALALAACVAVAACAGTGPGAPSTTAGSAGARTPLQLNQGWSGPEIEFYEHASEGTNLAPLEFVLNLPDPAAPQARFVDRLSRAYGFIPSPASGLNPHGLPVGFAIDERPTAYGDRAYLGINCAACHTRQLSYSKAAPDGGGAAWAIAVHGGPGLIDFPRFKKDLFDAILALLDHDDLMQAFGQRMLGRAPSADEVAAWRAEIREFTGPVVTARTLMQDWHVAPADFGPGNLNALTQGNYNNVGLGAWLATKGYRDANAAPPLQPRFEGAANYPPMWFAPSDTWAQWFVEIHHPGPRNWVQSVSTSEVRPPRMIEHLQRGSILGSIHFDNIARVQRSLELLRTPKWPADVFGPLDARLVEQGRALYEQQCGGCHTRKELPPNQLGIVFKNRPAFDVGTDAVAYTQFTDGGQRRVDDLTKLSETIIAVRRAQLGPPGDAAADDIMNMVSRGRPDVFAVARDDYASEPGATWPRSGAAYWASPMQGIFASSPYLHNGSVPTLRDLLNPPAQRPISFHTGSTEFDPAAVGLKDEGGFVFDTREPGKGNGGHLFGTSLAPAEKSALMEYLRSL